MNLKKLLLRAVVKIAIPAIIGIANTKPKPEGRRLQSFGNALKASRRRVFTSNTPHTTLIFCANHTQAGRAFDELNYILAGSSLKVEGVDYLSREVRTERSGKFKVVVIGRNYADHLAGVGFEDAIWLYEPDEETRRYVGDTIRGDATQAEAVL